MSECTDQLDANWASWRSLTAMHRLLVRSVEDRLQTDAKISGPDFEVLSMLLESRDHRLRNGDLATLLNWEKSRLSHQVKRMVARGLVQRIECSVDLRGTWISITDEGRHAVRIAMPERLAIMREVFFDVLSAEELELLRSTSQKVLDAIDVQACDALSPVVPTR